MLLIAIRNILQEKGRLVISLTGIIFAIILMLILMGIYAGAISQFTRFIDENPTDLVIAQDGIRDYSHGASLLSKDIPSEVQGTPNVKESVPMIANIAFLSEGSKTYDIFLTSFVNESKLGGPWDVKGESKIDDDEIIISETLAKKINKGIGENIKLLDQQFTIKGLVPDASSFGTNYAWVTLDKAASLTKLPIVSFIYVTLDDTSSRAQTVNRLNEQFPEASILTKEEFRNNNKAELEEVFLPIIGAIVGIAIVVGTAVIGLTVYTATIDKIKEYGVLKAIGVSNWQLFRIVALQSFLLVALGTFLGTVISVLISPLLEGTIGIPPNITQESIVLTAAIGLIMAVIAAFVPLRRLMRIDPAEVFKS